MVRARPKVRFLPAAPVFHSRTIRYLVPESVAVSVPIYPHIIPTFFDANSSLPIGKPVRFVTLDPPSDVRVKWPSERSEWLLDAAAAISH